MSEERFDRMDGRLDSIDGRLNGVDGRLDRLETGQAGLRGDVGRLDGRLDTLDRHMRVLHEDLISRIATIAEGPWATGADVNRLATRIDDLVESRIVPLEDAIRSPRPGRNPRSRGGE